MANRKDLAVLKTEMSRALGTESVDPARLVLDALEDFVLQKNGKAGLSDQRWVCGVLLRALLSPAAGDKPDGDEGVVAALEMHGVSTSIAERAAATAEVWKGKIDEKEGEGGVGPAEVQMFLQMMVAFGIRSKFDEEFLKKLVVKYPSRREMGKLAAELGFGEKMAGSRISHFLFRRNISCSMICFCVLLLNYMCTNWIACLKWQMAVG